MSTGKAIALLFAGLLGVGFGVLLLYQGIRPGADWFRDPRASYMQGHEAMHKILCRVAGVSFLLAGIALLIHSIRELLQ